MEKDRKKLRGRFVGIGTHGPESGLSSMAILALVAAAVLIGSAVWRSSEKIEDQREALSFVKEQRSVPSDTDADAKLVDDLIAEFSQSSSSSAPLSIGSAVLDQLATSYANLKASGEYTPEAGRQLGAMLAPMIKTDLAVKLFSRSEFIVSDDTSSEGGFAYQNALYEAFAPLRKNQTLEFELFGRYVETKDTSYLDELRVVADLYHEAAANMLKISTPSDVVSYAISLANALSEFGAVLDALAENADDPVASVVLIGSYNSAEQSVLNNFNAMRLYYANKLK